LTEVFERFDAKVSPEPNSGCWLWDGAMIPNGYGTFTPHTKVKVLAHRFSYERKYGLIPEGKQLDHLCRIRLCVNPDHLEVVTNAENQRRGVRANMTHCKHGHSLADAYIWHNPRHPHWTARMCRQCIRQRKKAV
jgi:hypothetical protein